jgi:hypothetical protein
MYSSGGRRESLELTHECVLLGCPIAPCQGWFEERNAQEPLAVPRRDRERHRAAGRVADDMEPAETVSVSLTKSPLDLGVEPEVGRWLIRCIDLEILGDRIDPISEPLKQRRVCKLRGQHATGQQHDRVAI